MSNHFTYEINERNLRIQLKEFVLPVSEDAWQKLETFSDSMVHQHREGRFKLNLNLNRSVVLPSVFGIIIILFSFLLVNFVSIKNPVKESAHKVEAQIIPAPAAPAAVEVKKQSASQVKAQAPVTSPVEEIKVAEVVVTEPVAATETPVKEEVPVVAKETPADLVSEEAKAEAKAKRRAKRRAEAIETQQLNEIRPTIISEERDSEIRPN